METSIPFTPPPPRKPGRFRALPLYLFALVAVAATLLTGLTSNPQAYLTASGRGAINGNLPFIASTVGTLPRFASRADARAYVEQVLTDTGAATLAYPKAAVQPLLPPAKLNPAVPPPTDMDVYRRHGALAAAAEVNAAYGLNLAPDLLSVATTYDTTVQAHEGEGWTDDELNAIGVFTLRLLGIVLLCYALWGLLNLVTRLGLATLTARLYMLVAGFLADVRREVDRHRPAPRPGYAPPYRTDP